MLGPWLSGTRPITVDVELALKGQGLQPGVRVLPAVLQAAQKAICEAGPVIEGRFVRSITRVERCDRTSVTTSKLRLESPAIAHELANAGDVAAVVCTLGITIDERVAALLTDDPVLALAFDGLGSAACDRLASDLCEEISREASFEGLQVTGSLTPGMIGWPLSAAQAEVFALVDPSPIGVTLLASGQMIPRKSISFIVGIGAEVRPRTSACERCSARDRCRYKGVTS